MKYNLPVAKHTFLMWARKVFTWKCLIFTIYYSFVQRINYYCYNVLQIKHTKKVTMLKYFVDKYYVNNTQCKKLQVYKVYKIFVVYKAKQVFWTIML